MWRIPFAGGFAFWLPDILVKASSHDTLRSVSVLSVLCPGSLLVAYALITAWTRESERIRIPLAMLIGVWVLGPTMISVAGTFGGGFWARQSNEWMTTFLGLALATVLPPITFVLSAYDGTLLGLLLATACAAVEAYRVNHVRS